MRAWFRALSPVRQGVVLLVLAAPLSAAAVALGGWGLIGAGVLFGLQPASLALAQARTEPFSEPAPARAEQVRESLRTGGRTGDAMLDAWVDRARGARRRDRWLGPLLWWLPLLAGAAVPVWAAVVRSPWWLLALLPMTALYLLPYGIGRWTAPWQAR